MLLSVAVIDSCLAQFQSLNLFLTPRLARYWNCPARSEAPPSSPPRSSGMVKRRLHGESALRPLMCAQVFIAQMLCHLL
jgi:hypothetical protein